MKKLFISCPMKDRTQEAIAKSKEDMHRLAEIYFGEPLEVIPSTISYQPQQTKNESLWYLGESIKRMADADYFIGIDYEPFFKGCMVESEVAKGYEIPSAFVNIDRLYSLQDCKETIRKYYDQCVNEALPTMRG